MNQMRIQAMRLAYRAAYRGLQLRMITTGRMTRGVKCVLTNSGQLLLVRHTYGQRATWYLPGGALRRGEHPRAAATREMQEELGIHRLRVRTLGTVELTALRGNMHLTCVHAELTDPAFRSDPIEIADAGWFHMDRLPCPLGREVTQALGLLGRAPSA